MVRNFRFSEMPPSPSKPLGGSGSKPQSGSSSKPQVASGGYNPSSSSSPKPKSGSMKVIWIPGRKKQHDKGVFRPTNQIVEHKHGDRKNEVWSLGGSKSHDNILTGRR